MATTSFNSYLSNHIYDNLVPKDDFFRQLNKVVDWYELTFDLHKLAENDHGGRPRHAPVVLFKSLFLSFLYDASDCDTENLCTYDLRCKYFLGLPITDSAPDYSTLCTFRGELLKQFGKEWLNKTFKQVVSSAVSAGISFGKLFALDATHTIADVNTEKDKERQKDGLLFLRGKHRERWLKYLHDPSRVTARKKRYVVERANGDLKDNHSLRRCRYLGLLKYQFQATMATIAYNLKRMVTILTGQHFRPI